MRAAEPVPTERGALVRRGLALNYVTLAYNVGEAVVALLAGVGAGSVALVGFGVDSVVEVAASGAAQWRLRSDVDPARRARAERRTVRWVGLSLVALALWVAYESAESLWRREAPARSPLGVAVLALSVVVMPLLARAKRRVARALASGALAAEATQTALCAYLSAIALAGVALNALLGWWWADPAAALAMTPIIAKEGMEGLRGRDPCADCACHE
jgi:divalent metal cation (Fe/Co/Zn/Cd) transporter